MSAPRIIEFIFSLLVAFLIIATLSFLSLRPGLKQARHEAQAEWNGLIRAVQDRNELLPGLIQAIRGFESGHAKLLEKLSQARSVSMRPGMPAKVVAALDEIDRSLAQIDKLLIARPQLSNYPPFSRHWTNIVRISRQVDSRRMGYNKSVRLYNGLLEAFPQSLVAPIFGFVPLTDYPGGSR
jgi:LemA protein